MLSQGRQGSGPAPTTSNSAPHCVRAGHEGVDAGGEGLEHRARIGSCVLPVETRTRLEAEAAEELVALHARRPNPLRPASIGPTAVVLHLEEPILRVHPALAEERVACRAGADMGNALGVTVDLDGRGGAGRRRRGCPWLEYDTAVLSRRACALGRLERVDRLGRAVEDVRHGPAFLPGIGVDLGAVVHLVLEHHHQDAPARERGSRRVDRLDAAIEPGLRCLASSAA